MCQNSKFFRSVKQIAQYRFLHFTVTETSVNDSVASRTVPCSVKLTTNGSWRPLEQEIHLGVTIFLKFVPSLTTTPPELLSEPAVVDKVPTCIESKESRIAYEENFKSL